MKQAGKRIPGGVQAQVTLQESGTSCWAQENWRGETALEPYDCEIIGLNCATGPKEMNDAVRYLAHNAPKKFCAAQRRAAENVGGVAHYGSRRWNWLTITKIHNRIRRTHCRRLLRDHACAHQSLADCCSKLASPRAAIDRDSGPPAPTPWFRWT